MDASNLPDGMNSTMYLTNAAGEDSGAAWLDELELEGAMDVAGAKSIGYMTHPG